LSSQEIALTQTVQKGGCAAKIAAEELHHILKQVRFPKAHPALRVDAATFDDAAIYQVSDEISLVQTLDFFTPILDSPRLFGAVAAANALSDVYAMGGKPKTAMGILAFPLATMPSSVIVELMQGASDKINEAGANFVGGHSIDDDTLKFGLSVTGFVHPLKVWTNAGAKPGDHLLLLKGLGTGTITAALKRRELQESQMLDAINSMTTLNNAVDFLTSDQISHIHAATDITGFGFSGHSLQMAKASQVHFKMTADVLPILPRAWDCLEAGFLTKAHRTNAQYTKNDIEISALNSIQQLLIQDPQTSGGLLLSVSPDHSAEILKSLRKPFPLAAQVGTVAPMQKSWVAFE
jgi:selenide,water dikinase